MEKNKRFYQSLGFLQIIADKYGLAFVLERRFKQYIKKDHRRLNSPVIFFIIY